MRFPLRFELSESVRSKRNVAECGVSFFHDRINRIRPSLCFVAQKRSAQCGSLSFFCGIALASRGKQHETEGEEEIVLEEGIFHIRIMLGEPVAVLAVLFVVGHFFCQTVEIHFDDGEVSIEEGLSLVIVHSHGIHAAFYKPHITETRFVEKVRDLPPALPESGKRAVGAHFDGFFEIAVGVGVGDVEPVVYVLDYDHCVFHCEFSHYTQQLLGILKVEYDHGKVDDIEPCNAFLVQKGADDVFDGVRL